MGRGNGSLKEQPLAERSLSADNENFLPIQQVLTIGQSLMIMVDYTDQIKVGDSVTLSGESLSGGSRSQFMVVKIESLRKHLDGQYHLSPIALCLRGATREELEAASGISFS
jgi:hypothetical protein